MSQGLSLPAFMALLTFLSAAIARAVPSDPGDVRNVIDGFATAWNHHDMDAFGKLFATDADFVNVAGARDGTRIHSDASCVVARRNSTRYTGLR